MLKKQNASAYCPECKHWLHIHDARIPHPHIEGHKKETEPFGPASPTVPTPEIQEAVTPLI